LRAFVINLERRVDRRRQFLAWNEQQPLAFEFFAAADGTRIDRGKLIAAGLLDATDREFNNGALGNALSQLALWRACAAGREPYLVFEDDACLRGDFWQHAKPMIERYLAPHHLMLFGFNTDSVTSLRGSDGFVSAMRFDESIKRHPRFFEEYRRLRDVRPNLFHCRQFWGTLAYAISPRGARALIDACFPLSSRRKVELIGENRELAPCGLDGMMNLALQEQRLDVVACYPALVLGPNSHLDSDIQRVGADYGVSATPARKLEAG